MDELFLFFFFFVKQKTAYEMRISDWSSDVCSSDLQFLKAPLLFLAYAGRRRRNRRIGDGLSAILGVENRPTQISRQRRTKQWAGIVSRQTVKTVRCGATGGGIELLVRLRSEGRRGGKECVRSCRFRWWQDN